MRILTVSHFFESHRGGIERVAGHLCRQFSELGVEAVWAASDEDDLPSHPIVSVPLRCSNPIENVTGLPMPIPTLGGMRLLNEHVRNCDAVIIHDALYATSICAMFMAKMHGKRTVLIQHIAAIPFSGRILRALMRGANFLVTRPMLSAADVRVFISDIVRRDLASNRARLTSELLFNGVDERIFHPENGEVSTALDRSATLQQRRLLFVGRYVEKKGLDILRALAEKRPDLGLTLVGSGPIRPQDWGLPNICDLGPKSPSELANLYRTFDLLILPSVGEGYPLVIQEAMACGLPVICGSPVDRADPNVGEWVRGVMIDLSRPIESAERCAEAIDATKLSVAERNKMSRYARAHYKWSRMAERLIELAHSPQAAF